MTKTGLFITLATAFIMLFVGVGIGIVMEREAHRQAWHAEKRISAGTENVGTQFYWGPRGIQSARPAPQRASSKPSVEISAAEGERL